MHLFMVTVKVPEDEKVPVGECPVIMNEACTAGAGGEHTVPVQASSSSVAERVIRERGYEVVRIERGWVLEVC